MKKTKCGNCRRPTVWKLYPDHILRCNNCRKPATPSLRANRCKHLFMDRLTQKFSTVCLKNCGVELSDNLVSVFEAQQRFLEKQQEENKLEKEIQDTFSFTAETATSENGMTEVPGLPNMDFNHIASGSQGIPFAN